MNKLEPIPDHPGLYRDPITKAVINVRNFVSAHVIWTFREGPKNPSVRLATSMPKTDWPFVLNAVSAPRVGNGEGYFRLREFAAPLIDVQQFKSRSILVKDLEMLKEAELYNADVETQVTVVGFGYMRQSA